MIVAEESVLRGADWLEQRWRDGGSKLKHMAIAVRASGLTPAEFSGPGGAGPARSAGPERRAVTVIPDDARGRAYVQNHPCPRTAGEWAYDAVNEVWFDDLESLRTRIAWFRENLSGRAEADLVRQSWFIAVREQVVLALTGGDPCRRASWSCSPVRAIPRARTSTTSGTAWCTKASP